MRRHPLRQLVKFILVGIVSASVLGLCLYGLITTYFMKTNLSKATFRLPAGQKLFLVVKDDWTDNWTDPDDDDDREHIETDLRAERLVREEFTKHHKAKIADNKRDANFILLIVIDPQATTKSVLAEILTPECYEDSAPVNHCQSRWRAWGDSPAQVVERFHKDVLQ
jgi:hypothetical protein